MNTINTILSLIGYIVGAFAIMLYIAAAIFSAHIMWQYAVKWWRTKQ